MSIILLISMAFAAFMAGYGAGNIIYAPHYSRKGDKVVWYGVHGLQLALFGGGYAFLCYSLIQTSPSEAAVNMFCGLLAALCAIMLTEKARR